MNIKEVLRPDMGYQVMKDFKFEERVKINCFYCSKYNTKWTCPPRIPNLNYKAVLGDYENIYLIYYTNEDRRKSTNELHLELLRLEKILWDEGYPMAISFIGGSCKLCKDGCPSDKCNNPGSARIPIEALGINIIDTLEITFKGPLTRYGMILW